MLRNLVSLSSSKTHVSMKLITRLPFAYNLGRYRTDVWQEEALGRSYSDLHAIAEWTNKYIA